MVNVIERNGKQLVEVGCNSCDYVFEQEVNSRQVEQLRSRSELIQVILPNVSSGDREMFISGICGGCFDNMFNPLV